MGEIVKVYKIELIRFFKIGPVIDFGIKKYLTNTNVKYYKKDVKSNIFEFRYINGKRYTYEEPFEDMGFQELTDKLLNYIKDVKEFINLIIVYIRKK